jgi:hypothetical protein
MGYLWRGLLSSEFWMFQVENCMVSGRWWAVWRKDHNFSQEAESWWGQTQAFITTIPLEFKGMHENCQGATHKLPHAPSDHRISSGAHLPKVLPPPNSATLGTKPLITMDPWGTQTIYKWEQSQYQIPRYRSDESCFGWVELSVVQSAMSESNCYEVLGVAFFRDYVLNRFCKGRCEQGANYMQL